MIGGQRTRLRRRAPKLPRVGAATSAPTRHGRLGTVFGRASKRGGARPRRHVRAPQVSGRWAQERPYTTMLLVAVVMAILAIPFALSMGRRGSLTGIAVAIAVALAYWVIDGLFGAMGNVNYLPAPLAAWSSDVLFGLTGGYLLLRTPT